MEKTAGRFVITAQKNQCCSVGGGKKEYYFCDGSSELLEEIRHRYSLYGGDNYGVCEFNTKEQLIDCYGEDGEEAKTVVQFPVFAITHSGVVEFKNFTEEMEFANYLVGDCGDWLLSFEEDDEIDIEQKIEILQAEMPIEYESAVESAWLNLW